MLSECRHHRSLFECELLSQLPALETVEGLGLSAVARVRLCSPDAPFAAYLVGYDRNNTCHGLVVADELRLGHIYLSGLEVAQRVWAICLELDTEWNPAVLWDVVKDYALCPSKPAQSKQSHTSTRLRATQTRLTANLSKEQ